MNSDSKDMIPNIGARINEHFEKEDPEEVVRRSQQLMLYPGAAVEKALSRVAVEGPALAHPRSRPIPLNAYLASALTQLSTVDKALIVHLSDIVNLVCRAVAIDLYEPRKRTDPVHHADFRDSEVFRIDRERVVSSDLLIHLCHYASTGSGEELSFAYDALVPIILIAPGDHNVSRMITGIPSLKIEIRYHEPEDLRSLLEQRLWEIRPLLEQRRLAMNELSHNIVGAKIKELRLGAGLSKEELAKRVGLKPEGLANIEDNVDTVSNPSLTTLRVVATALKTTVAELVNPDYTEAILASIQSTLNESAVDAAARFRGMSDKDRRALLRRFLVRFLYFVEEQDR